MTQIRLQKILSAAGIASRRAAETLITQGRVTVNAKTVTELGTKADPETDDIRVDGRRVKTPARRRYILLNKPRGYITSRSDPQHRPTVIESSRGRHPRLRLSGRPARLRLGRAADPDERRRARGAPDPSEPRRRREYEVRVLGVPDEHELERIARGVIIDGRRTAPGGRQRDQGDRDARRRADAAVDRGPRRAQPTGPEDVRSDRSSGRPAAARRDRPDHRRPAASGRFSRAVRRRRWRR